MPAKRIIVFCLFVFSLVLPQAQIPNGSWRDHLAYIKAHDLAITPKKVYCTFDGSGMLSYNRETGEIERLTTVQNLSDIEMSQVCYASDPEVLIIGYNSGDIDLITHDGIINMPYIVQKLMTSSKRINKIKVVSNLAYLACDFGIVVINLEKKEVKDSYIFGQNGSSIQVNDLAVSDDGYIYAATEKGLYKAALNSPNLLDYSYWNQVDDVLLPMNLPCKLVESFSGKIFTVYSDSSATEEKILVGSNNTWSEWSLFKDTEILGLDVNNDKFSVCGLNKTEIFNTDFLSLFSINLNRCYNAIMDEDGKVFTASYYNGFYYYGPDNESYLAVNNPRFNSTGLVSTKDDQVWIGSGGPFRPYTEGGAYNFSDEKWFSINTGWGQGLTDVGNIYKIAYDPADSKHIYASGYFYGLYEIEDQLLTRSYTYDNTELFRQNINPIVLVRISGLDFDSKGNLWTIFDDAAQPVYSYWPTEQKWTHYNFSSSVFVNPGKFADLVVADNDQIWILSKKNGIAVLKQNDDGTFSENHFSIKNSNGDLLSLAYCMTKDNDGNIWVGTNKGPIIYSPSNDILTESDVRGYQVKIARNDGTDLADYLLDYEIINSIAVDGGNRKWIATENSGVFLVSDDGKETIHQFTTDNSPLISNNVIGVGVQEKTGEVFFSTNKGIISYMGNSTEGASDFSNVLVYPNPIRPEYKGDITISGLVENSVVKITDVSGNLVYECVSLGGQAVWNGNNFYGERASTGVYLVFLSNEDGSKTHITKLLFIH
ncbi:MAG: hypothetical protein JXA77_19020 [Bacteroidales bacterium]|nr:hypothetical protein [Bacteroidales bacterium]MBN2821382.1 hypothetical protein [Bacteroidales bacterium]